VRDEGVKIAYEAADTSGSTANVAVVTESHVIVANVGDSRAVLVYRDPTTKELRAKVRTLATVSVPALTEYVTGPLR
jgi:serine/threonine protein phosphatase PrpC